MKEKTKHSYAYGGLVLDRFGNVMETYWTSETWAESRQKAKSNLMCQYKKERNLPMHCKIELPGRIVQSD